MSEVEMDDVALGFEFVDGGRIAGESVACGHVVVQDDDLTGDVCQLAEFIFRWGNVHEGNECIFAFTHSHAVVVTAGDKMTAVAPGGLNGPNGPETIRASRMVETDFFHGSSDSAVVGSRCCWPRRLTGGREPECSEKRRAWNLPAGQSIL
jgi:hypothetical protein